MDEAIQKICSTISHNEPHDLQTSNKLLSYFSDPTEKRLPFPGESNYRFEATTNGTNHYYVYFGREIFGKFVKEVNERMASKNPSLSRGMRVIGSMGIGKSHIVATYALYLQCSRILGIHDTPRVLYFSFCCRSYRIQSNVLDALEISFPEQKDFFTDARSTRPFDERRMENIIETFMRNQVPGSMIFIYDDWNIYEDVLGRETIDEVTAKWLISITANQFRIEVFTAETKAMRSQYHLPEFPMCGGLTDNEWNVWKRSERFYLFNERHMNEETENHIKYITGLIPIFLSNLCSYDAKSIDAAFERYGVDSDGSRAGGSWIKSASLHFIVDNRLNDRYIQMISDAISESHCSYYDSSLCDHRFFDYDETTGILKPVCGYVARIVIEILIRNEDKQKRDVFFNSFNKNWTKTDRINTNPIINGFVFKLYCIHDVISNMYRGLDSVKINRFYESFPSYVSNSSNGMPVIHWSYILNARFVDLVIREPAIVSVNTRNTTNSKKAKIKPIVVLKAFRFTIQSPMAHRDSLKFYTESIDGKIHYQRYLEDSDDFQIRHEFYWYIPEQIDAEIPPMPSTHFSVTQYINVIKLRK